MRRRVAGGRGECCHHAKQVETTMLSMLFTAVISTVVAGSGGTLSYDEALRESRETGKPLMVVVSSDACPACVALKNNTIEPMRAAGELEEVCLVVVNKDRDPDLAGRLMRGRMIPQIVMYSNNRTGWKRTQMTGYQSRAGVGSLVRKALRLSRRGS
jgi:hypothetical protein